MVETNGRHRWSYGLQVGVGHSGIHVCALARGAGGLVEGKWSKSK